jgi:hypothetical protein
VTQTPAHYSGGISERLGINEQTVSESDCMEALCHTPDVNAHECQFSLAHGCAGVVDGMASGLSNDR